MFIVVLMFIILTVSLIIFSWIRRRYSFWKNLGVPYEEPHFPYGSFKGVKANAHEGQTLEKFYQKFKNHTPFVGIYFALEPIALILDIESVQKVLISDFSAFQDRGLFFNAKHEPISAHLGLLSTDKWKSTRAMLSPAFTATKIKSMFPMCLHVAATLDSKLNEFSQSREDVDIKKLAERFTIDIMGLCISGIECNCLMDENNELFRVLARIFSNPLDSSVSALMKLALRHHTETFRIKSFRQEVSDFFSNLVKSLLELRIVGNVYRNDLFETLTAAYQSPNEDRMSFNEVLANTFGFFAAGFETSASTLQFCLYELAQNLQIQEEARNHVRKILNQYENKLTFEVLSEMKYIDQLVNETLRKYPALGTLTRELVRDYKVPTTNCTLKKGTLVMIPVYAIHHDPQIYPNPETFNPDRFSEANVKSRPATTFLGFGEGPRHCIGSKLGIMQTKIGLVTALQKYQFTVAKKSAELLKLETRTFVTCPAKRIYLNVHKAKTQF